MRLGSDGWYVLSPDADRYRHIVGSQVELPLSGRRIPIVPHPHVDPTFATGPGEVKVLGMHYDQETGAYYDSWRADTFLGYRWGDVLATGWQTGLAFERMDAGDSPETYTQVGLRGGVEAYGPRVGGQITLEYGRRTYDQAEVSLGEDLLTADTLVLYTDFNYWKIWVMGNWDISRHFALDLMASYEPENHTEPTEDTSIGYASVRLVWRP